LFLGVSGKILGIVGMGSGQAGEGEGFDMNVLYHDSFRLDAEKKNPWELSS
jgi:lactate dehydrogenase-like 2-hydroxyacid dehydrogenase